MSAEATEPAPLPEIVSFVLRSSAEDTAASAPATRFRELTGLLLDTIARLRT